MKKSYFVLTLIVLAVILGKPIPLAFSQVVGNVKCPVMPGEAVKEKFHVDYQGKRIYLCCRNCVRAFKKRPEKYLKNLKDN